MTDKSRCPVCGTTDVAAARRCSLPYCSDGRGWVSSTPKMAVALEPLLQAVGGSMADVIEQMILGKWQDDHGHPVVNNAAMVDLKDQLKAIMKFRHDYLGYTEPGV